MLGARKASFLEIGDSAKDVCASHECDVALVHFDAVLDDRCIDHLPVFIIGLIDFLEVLPFLFVHVDRDQHIPTLASILHHSLEHNPSLSYIPVFEKTEATTCNLVLRIVFVDPLDEVVVLRTEITLNNVTTTTTIVIVVIVVSVIGVIVIVVIVVLVIVVIGVVVIVLVVIVVIGVVGGFISSVVVLA